MSAPITLVELPNNVITNIVGSPLVETPSVNMPAIDTITSVNNATMFVLVYDPNASGEKIKKVSVADFIASLEIITL